MMGGQMGYPPQFDMQGYAKQMVDFFQQFVGGKTEGRKLEEELEESRREIERLRGETQVDLRLTELTAEVETLQKRIMSTEEELVQTQRERDEIMTHLELGDHYPSEREEEVTELRRRLADTLERTAALERSVGREREMRTEAEKRAEIAKAKLGKAEKACEELKLELKNVQEEAAISTQELTSQLKKAQREVESLCNELSTLRKHSAPLPANLSGDFQLTESPNKPVTRGKESLQRRATYTSRDNRQAGDPESSSLRASPDLRKVLRNSTESLQGNVSARSAKMEEVKGIENELMKLQIERDMAMVEFNKLPDYSKTQTQRRRREELDRELEHYTSSINSLKLQLRALTSKRV
jgi:chromosome segregation ATPase